MQKYQIVARITRTEFRGNIVEETKMTCVVLL